MCCALLGAVSAARPAYPSSKRSSAASTARGRHCSMAHCSCISPGRLLGPVGYCCHTRRSATRFRCPCAESPAARSVVLSTQQIGSCRVTPEIEEIWFPSLPSGIAWALMPLCATSQFTAVQSMQAPSQPLHPHARLSSDSTSCCRRRPRSHDQHSPQGGTWSRRQLHHQSGRGQAAAVALWSCLQHAAEVVGGRTPQHPGRMTHSYKCS